MGRPPKPTQLHVLDGTLRPDRRHGQGEPTADLGDCSPPAHLSDEARAVWERLAPEMEAKQLLAPRYLELFEAFCSSVVYMRRAARLVDAMGPIIKGRSDSLVSNPASTEFARYARLLQRLGSELGLSPVATAVIGRGVGASYEHSDSSARRLMS
jgi:P27 family predicted phage terminase small subunit